MAKGRLIYSGHAQSMMPFFAQMGLPVPEIAPNPADFAIHSITAIEDAEELNRFATANIERQEASETPAKSFSISINEEEHRPLLLDRLDEDEALIQQNLELGEFSQPFLIQFVFLALRSLKNSWRSKVLIVQYITSLVIGLVLGGVYYQITVFTSGVQNRTGVILFVVVLLSVLSLSSMETFLVTRELFVR